MTMNFALNGHCVLIECGVLKANLFLCRLLNGSMLDGSMALYIAERAVL